MTSRLKIAKAMRKAVERLAGPVGGKDYNSYNSRWYMNEFICHAIEDGNPGKGAFVYTDAAMRARTAIHKRLEGCETLESWLLKKGVPPADITFDRLQAHRHKWLKMLIKEYETK